MSALPASASAADSPNAGAMKINLLDLAILIKRLSFRDYWFRIGNLLGDGYFLQVVFKATDCETGEPSEQRGRKWYISQHAVSDEVIKTCWLAVEIALRHEALEDFKLDGIAFFNPHTDCERLRDLQHDPEAIVRRENGTIAPQGELT